MVGRNSSDNYTTGPGAVLGGDGRNGGLGRQDPLEKSLTWLRIMVEIIKAPVSQLGIDIQLALAEFIMCGDHLTKPAQKVLLDF